MQTRGRDDGKRIVAHAAAALVLIVTGTAGAQRDAAKPAAGSGVIRGSVIAADSEAPIPDAVVSLRDADVEDTVVASTVTVVRGQFNASRTRTTRLNAAGRFEFVGLLPGRYRLAVNPGQTAARYLPARYPDPDVEPSMPLSVTGNQVIDQVVIPLPRAAAITGRVVNHSGNPIAMAIVMAQEALAGDRLRPAQGFSSALGDRTDDTGSFRIFGLRPGAYIVTAQPIRESYLSVDRDGIISGGVLPPTYFPGTVSPSDATRIRVRSGDEHGPIEIIVSPTRFLTVRGVLLDPDGQPAANVNVSLQRQTSGLGGVTVQGNSSRADGTFEIRDVAAGEQAIAVNRYGPPGAQYAWMPLTVHDDIEGLTIRLQPGVTIKGQVVFEGAAPNPLPTMYIRSVSGRYGRSGAPSGVMPAPDLSFALEHQFGPTLIRVEPPSGWHLKSVLHGGSDVTDVPTEFGEGTDRVQVVLTQRAASLTGAVTTTAGGAIQGSVVVLSDDPALWHERASSTAIVPTTADGKYRVEGLRAGRYLIVAIPKEEPPAPSLTPSYFEQLAKHATALSFGEGESKTLDLKRVAVQ
jgi:hypothetical protein